MRALKCALAPLRGRTATVADHPDWWFISCFQKQCGDDALNAESRFARRRPVTHYYKHSTYDLQFLP